MCTLLIAHDCHPTYRLVVLANRDEFYHRASDRLAPWAEAPEVVAGRDGQAGGTWMGASKAGRWAAITNVREPGVRRDPAAPSRGRLVADYLRGSQSATSYVSTTFSTMQEYAGFNLLVGEMSGEVWWLSNRAAQPEKVTPGIHGLSNHLLDTPWPKVRGGCAQLKHLLTTPTEIATPQFFSLLEDPQTYPDAELPDTGVGLEVERLLSALLIRSEAYGTVSSTVLTVTHAGVVQILERVQLPDHNDDDVRVAW